MIWPFKKKTQLIIDDRNWNENWQVGDTAECIVEFNEWSGDVPPWERLPKGGRYIVTGFSDGLTRKKNARAYWLQLEGIDDQFETIAFRKVLPFKKAEETEIGVTILQAKPAPDIKRTKPAKVPHD